MNYLILLLTVLCSFSADALTLKDHHFVLVGGLNNELVPTYFKTFEKILRDHGVSEVDRVLPTSYQTVLENVPVLRERLEALYREGGSRPLIISAHSKGGLELLHVMLQNHRDFFPEKVKYLVFANVPFQGSPFMKIAIKKLESPIYSYNPVIQAQLRALRSLETNTITSELEKSFTMVEASEKKEISSRVLYIRTQEDARNVNFTLNESAAYLKDVANDGLIPLANQRLPEFGQDLTVETSTDHTDLFVSPMGLDRAAQLEKILNLLSKKADSRGFGM